MFVGNVVAVMKQWFSIPNTTECRLWGVWRNHNELLQNLKHTVSDAGIPVNRGQVS